MAPPFRAALALLVLAVARAQQDNEANAQLNCYARNDSSVLGYACNATASAAPCDSYLVFRSSPPLYSTAVSISFLLNSTPFAVADATAVTTVSPDVDASRLVLAPVPCDCTAGGYYQQFRVDQQAVLDANNLTADSIIYPYTTQGFSDGRRVAGTSVYRAVINGDAAAVKRVSGDVSGEVGILMRVNHSSLVRLSGLCVHGGNTYLIFEFTENGALRDWLHGGGGASLAWKQRVQAAFDVADGLNYLHHYTSPPCVHKNLNSSNILLDPAVRIVSGLS